MEQEGNMEIQINSGLQEEIESLISADPNTFSNIHNFAEKAIRNYISSIKYNIEGGIDSITMPNTGVLKPSEKAFTFCTFCSRMFLKDRSAKHEGSKICIECKRNILFFSKILEQDKEFVMMKGNLQYDEESGKN